MAPRGRPPALDDARRREILAILAVGGTRQLAASYVGCVPRTIDNTAARLPEFAAALRQVEPAPEVGYLESLRRASRDPKYWRAAAWALERLYPGRYAPGRRDAVPLDEVVGLMKQVSEVISREVPSRFRQAVLGQLTALFSGHPEPPPAVPRVPAPAPHDPQNPEPEDPAIGSPEP